MSKKIIHFDRIKMNPSGDFLNLKTIGVEEKSKYFKEFEARGYFNGGILVSGKCDLREDKTLEVFYKHIPFFDFLITGEDISNDCFSISVNAIIEVEDSIVVIKREKDVYSYSGWIDFPAGIVRDGDKMNERMMERIFSDTGIRYNIKLIEMIPVAVLLDNIALNFFYKLKYNGSKEDLLHLFNLNYEKDAPILLKKSDMENFVKNNSFVFPEILKELY